VDGADRIVDGAPPPQAADTGRGERVTWLGIGSELVLATVKLLAGWVGHSQALLVDGIHSLSDLVSDFVTLFALGLGRKPRDPNHPYGHGKFEDLATLLIGLILIVVAAYMAVHAVTAFREGNLPERRFWLPAVALLSVLVKEWLYRITRRVGDELRSPTLIANAWHHRSDALSSLATLVGIGLFVIHPGFTWADMAAAILVAAFIVRAGGKICWQAVRDLVDTAPRGEHISEIEACARGIAGVENLRRPRGRYYAQRVALDLDIEVRPTLSVQEGHDIAQRVEEEILGRFPEVYHVMVHVEPHSGGSDGVE